MKKLLQFITLTGWLLPTAVAAIYFGRWIKEIVIPTLKGGNFVQLYDLHRVRYLDTTHLKTIDVICRDTGGDVKRRYDEFISFERYRSISGDIRVYMTQEPRKSDLLGDEKMTLNLEQRHTQFIHGN
jgi:hypothetical protein